MDLPDELNLDEDGRDEDGGEGDGMFNSQTFRVLFFIFFLSLTRRYTNVQKFGVGRIFKKMFLCSPRHIDNNFFILIYFFKCLPIFWNIINILIVNLMYPC